ncbi:hypothetical protein [Streptomyces qinzhouensis]|uniref:Uncharacterized protein n=1 Tax=Streptomyces qinzhouensis TaxID=2599401 RepID=A0A5B8JLA0_9ACTN|nr:hypothetical protein [Streptomyces qinzhouensis]QDY78500.1 hypothetical protein FQU76_20590 [Streptomyces qinzhouensis]
MTIRTVWHAPTGQTQEDTRLATSLVLTPTGSLSSRGGVIPGGLELEGVNALQCRIMTGRAVIQTSARQGAYMIAVTDPEIVTLAPGSADGSRKDLIYLTVEDAPYDASGATQAVIRVVQGATAVTDPLPPSAPANSLPLFVVTVGRNAASINWGTVENRRYPTAALGGIVPTGGFDGLYKGQYRDNGDRLERWNGGPTTGTWQPYPLPSTWRAWTPQWTASTGTNPTPGNATVDCRYVQDGSTVHFNFRMVFGTTTNFRTGNWRFSLPVPAARATHSAGFLELHQAEDQLPTPADRAIGRIRLTSTTYFEIEMSSGKLRGGATTSAGIVDAAYPWAWKVQDHIVGSGTYEAAGTA